MEGGMYSVQNIEIKEIEKNKEENSCLGELTGGY